MAKKKSTNTSKKRTTTKKTPTKKVTTSKTVAKKTTTMKAPAKKTVTKKPSSKKNVKKTTKNTKFNLKETVLNILIAILVGLKICIKYIWKFIKFVGIAIYNFFKEDEKSKKKKEKYDTILKYDSSDNLILLDYKEYKGLKKIPVFFKNRKMVRKYDMKKFKEKFKYGTLRDKILIVIMIGLIAVFSLGIVFCGYVVATAPEISEKRLYKNNATVLLDVNGNEFKRLGTENREKVSYDQLPEVLVDAIVATEDSRFFQHNGIDLARFTKAAFGQLLGRGDAGGGSTLTMQVSKNAATNTSSHGIQGIVRKFTDIYLSVFVFEKKYTKEQIMEFYVNLPNLGSGAYGVEQASKIYFGKSVSELNLAEAALIAGMFQAPSAYNPYVYPEKAEARRNQVLNLMCKHGYITEEERDIAKSIPVKSMLYGRDTSLSPYIGFIDTVVEEAIERTGLDPYTNSMVIHTTMDPTKQDVVNDVMNGVTYKWENEYAQGGIAVVSVSDGSIVAVGAGRNKTAERSFNYGTSASRHPGSTAKPVIDYGPAIEYLGWGTGQTVIDDKYNYSSGGSIKNWDNGFKGIMTIKTALAQSRNIPALYTFQQTTNEQKKDFANNMGWKPEESSGVLLESDSIGGFKGVTPLESAAAYATFARGGTYIEPYSFTKIEFTDTGETYEVKPKKIDVMSEETAYLITMILKYAVTSGNVNTGYTVPGTDVCAKTGTSTVDGSVKKSLGIKGSIIGDSWEAVYSPDYAFSTWYGYPTLNKDHYLTQAEGGRARKGITKALVKGIMNKNSSFSKPSGVVTAEIELETDPIELASAYTPSELRSTEYFKKGTVPSETSQRFAQLDNVTNLNVSTNGNTATLTWNAIATPSAIDEGYLNEYFSNSKLYGASNDWKNKYLNARKEYNNNVFGSLGYRVYVVSNSGTTTDLGFTTNTNFTYTTDLSTVSYFIVKSSYQKFTANIASGTTAKVSVQSSNSPQTPQQEETKISVVYAGAEKTYAYIKSHFDKSLLTVTANGSITTDYTHNLKVVNTSNGVVASSINDTMSGVKYRIEYEVTYKGKTVKGTLVEFTR